MSKQILRKGITGFIDAQSETSLPEISHKDIIQAYHSTARLIHQEISSEKWAGISQNYHSIDIGEGRNAVSVLFNAHYPLIAFTSSGANENDLELRFCDNQILQDEFERHNSFQVLTANDLKRPVEEGDLKHLSKADLQQIGYWKPKSIGEIIFNNWD